MTAEQRAALAEALIALAWRDRVVRTEEIGCLRLLLLRLGLSREEAQALLERETQAPTQEALEPLKTLLTDPDSRRTAMRMLVAVCFADHETAPQELDLLASLARAFGYGADDLEAARLHAAILLDPCQRPEFSGPCRRCRVTGPLFEGHCPECWERVAPAHPEWGDVCGRCGRRVPAFATHPQRRHQRCEFCLGYCPLCDFYENLEGGLCSRCRPAPTELPPRCHLCERAAAREGFCRSCASSPATLERLDEALVDAFRRAFFRQVREGLVHLYADEWRVLEARLPWRGKRCRRCGSPCGDPGSHNNYQGNCWECWDG